MCDEFGETYEEYSGKSIWIWCPPPLITLNCPLHSSSNPVLTAIYFCDYQKEGVNISWGGPPKMECIYKTNCGFILTCLNFSHLQSTLHLMQYTYWDVYFHCSKLFLNLSIPMPSRASAGGFFCFVLSLQHQQNVSLWGLFSSLGWGGRCSGQEWMNREGGAQGSCHFWSKTGHSGQCGQVHWQITRHEMGKGVERVFTKNSLKPNSTSHNNASWGSPPPTR